MNESLSGVPSEALTPFLLVRRHLLVALHAARIQIGLDTVGGGLQVTDVTDAGLQKRDRKEAQQQAGSAPEHRAQQGSAAAPRRNRAASRTAGMRGLVSIAARGGVREEAGVTGVCVRVVQGIG